MQIFLARFVNPGISLEKISMAVSAGAILLLIWATIILVAYLGFKIKLWRRWDFWFFIIVCFIVIIIKVVALRFLTNYFFERFPIYALLSPKIKFYPAVFASVALFLVFIKYYKKLLKIDLKFFLAVLVVFSVIFSLSIALIRDGAFGLYESFLRSTLDYYPDAMKIGEIGLPSFLRNYDQIQPTLAMHGAGHPPGYALIHYFFIQLFNNNLIALAVGIAFLGAMTLVPVYFLARRFDENSARLATIIFSFAPAFVIFSATCIDVVFLTASGFLFWSLFSSRGYLHWMRSATLYAIVVFMQFMAFLFLPIVALYSFLKNNRDFKKTAVELAVFTLTFCGIYLLMKIFTGFDLYKSFQTARRLVDLHVMSNYTSIKSFIGFILLSIPPFFVYLAGPLLLAYIKKIKERPIFQSDTPEKIFFILGLAFLPVLLLAGIFQAETERLWLFLLPFFVLPAAKNIITDEERSATLMVLFLQIISIQILFYTYW